MIKRKVEVVPYSSVWENLFTREQVLLKELFGKNEVGIYHIGSTSVPGLSAKPIIDVLIEVETLELIDLITKDIERAGYEAKGENGIAGRRFFQKSNKNGVRLYHVHAFKKGNPEINRHLVFRDYLRIHPEKAAKYAEVKQQAAARNPYDIETYMIEKEPIIKELEQEALRWRLKQ
ncbi:GrpB family protein [Mesobacillus maritimus]|uniref:GrpB family protein n=1 Tax=Mesobacillus maritimus TaxID=1643336 RepID=A0ABS7K2J6_9BACI|nr:GrpB family protein [Mesobacillus maritimus]MBY0096474.1 GrpB family protein [Mesobacillus maritimus]